jgi:hypothetical protein
MITLKDVYSMATQTLSITTHAKTGDTGKKFDGMSAFGGVKVAQEEKKKEESKLISEDQWLIAYSSRLLAGGANLNEK